MAAALIPILGSVIPVLVPTIVSLVEKLFGNGGGPKKLDAAQSLLADLFKRFQDANPGVGLPAGDELRKMIQDVVDQMNRVGSLKGTDTTLTTAPVSVNAEAMRGMDLMLEGALVLMRAGRLGKP